MPKPQEVVVDELKKDDKPVVEVSLDENHNPVKESEKPKEEAKYVRLEDIERISKAVENSRQWSQRKIGSIEEKIEKFLSGLQQPPQRQPEVSTPKDEWDEMLQKDWKGTV